MIIDAELINQPYSSDYHEKIYDISTPWSSSEWTWVKFTTDAHREWCGNFRGSPRGVAVSEKYNCILVLTSDFLYKLSSSDGELLAYEAEPQFQVLTVTPSGEFIAADCYSIVKLEPDLKTTQPLKSPIEMDDISFGEWKNSTLTIQCTEFLNDANKVTLELHGEMFEVSLIHKK